MQPEYNKAGDEVWFAVWSAKNKGKARSWWWTTRPSSSEGHQDPRLITPRATSTSTIRVTTCTDVGCGAAPGDLVRLQLSTSRCRDASPCNGLAFVPSGAVAGAYLVPKMRSPASPRPGRILAVVVQLAVDGSGVDRHIRVGLLQRGHALGRGQQADELDGAGLSFSGGPRRQQQSCRWPAWSTTMMSRCPSRTAS